MTLEAQAGGGGLKTRKINYEAWSRSMIGFIRERNLEIEFRDWSGGFPCPVKTLPTVDCHDELFAALKPFAKALDDWGDDQGQPDRWNIWEHPTASGITLGDLRRARAAIQLAEGR